MKPKNTICLLALACAFATGARAQDIISPTTKAETDERISNRAQLTTVPTIYIWMLDAEVEYDENNNPVKPMEYKNTTGDKNDNYYLVKREGGSSYDTPISNNIIAEDPDCTNNVALRPNYGQWDNPKPDEYRLARIKVVDVTGSIKSRDELTTIRGRGNSTWSSPKKAYRLKFPSKTKFLAKEDGTNEYADAKNWTLLANVADKTMLRNSLASEIGRRIEDKTGVKGLPYYPAFKFVDVVLNNEYIGSYQISDHTQIQAERINIDEDNGWLLEGVSTNDAFIEDAHVTVNGLVVNVKNPEDDLYENAKADIESYLGTVYSLGQWSDWVPGDFSEATGFFKYVDLESVVAYFIGNEISGNYDGLISNYAYRDINPGDKLKMGPLWDFDIAFGNFGNLKEGFIFDAGKIGYGFLPDIARNLTKHSPEFVKLLVERWDKVYSYQPENRPEGSTLGQYDYPVDNGVSNYLWHRIFRIPDETKQSFALNYTPKENGGAGWKTTEDYLYWVGGTFNSYDEACTSMWHFIVDHNHWLNTAIHQLKENMMASDYTHDATSTATSLGDHDGKICKATVINRTFTAGEWNTICLPFSLTKDELQAKFGDDVVLMEYKSIANNQMLFAEVADKRLAAGVPYLIKPSKVEQLVFDEVALSCPNPATVSYADNTAYAFKGTYFKSSIADDGTTMLLDADNEVFKANSSVSSLDGCSAYIVCPAGTNTVPIFSTVSLPDDQDNTSLLADLSGKTIDLTLTDRTFYHDGSWNTLCLPFNIDDFTGTPLEGATVMKFVKKQTSFSGSTLTIGFEGSQKINAGKPYLVKWTDGAGEVKDPTFRNVTISATEPGSYEATDVFMLGTFSPVTLRAGDTQKLYLGEGNTLYYPQNDVPVKACRAYFELQGELTAGDTESSSLVRSFELVFDGQETAISEIYSVTNASAGDNAWYTLDGRRLSSEPTAPGIYVNRGRKIVIK